MALHVNLGKMGEVIGMLLQEAICYQHFVTGANLEAFSFFPQMWLFRCFAMQAVAGQPRVRMHLIFFGSCSLFEKSRNRYTGLRTVMLMLK